MTDLEPPSGHSAGPPAKDDSSPGTGEPPAETNHPAEAGEDHRPRWPRRQFLLTGGAAVAGAAVTAAGFLGVPRLLADRPAGEQLDVLRGHTGAVRAVAVGKLNGDTVAVSASQTDRTVRVWQLATGDQIRQFDAGADAPPGLVAVGLAVGTRLGTPVALSGGVGAPSVQVWDLAGDRPVRLPFLDHDGNTYPAWVSSVAFGRWDGGPVAVSVGPDRTVHMWDLRDGSQLGETITLSTEREGLTFPLAVAIGQRDGTPVVVTAGHLERPWITVWDLVTGAPVSSMDAHDSEVHAVAVGALDGQPVVVSGSNDRTVRVWDLQNGDPKRILTGHERQVRAVAYTEVAGIPVAVSGGDDRTVRVWDLARGAQIGPALTGHTGDVTAVATGTLDGEVIAVSAGGSNDHTIRVWRLPVPSR